MSFHVEKGRRSGKEDGARTKILPLFERLKNIRIGQNGEWFSMRTHPATGALSASPGIVFAVQPPPGRKGNGRPGDRPGRHRWEPRLRPRRETRCLSGDSRPRRNRGLRGKGGGIIITTTMRNTVNRRERTD